MTDSVCACGTKVKVDTGGVRRELIGSHAPAGRPAEDIFEEHLCQSVKLKISEAIVAAVAIGKEFDGAAIKQQIIETNKPKP